MNEKIPELENESSHSTLNNNSKKIVISDQERFKRGSSQITASKQRYLNQLQKQTSINFNYVSQKAESQQLNGEHDQKKNPLKLGITQSRENLDFIDEADQQYTFVGNELLSPSSNSQQGLINFSNFRDEVQSPHYGQRKTSCFENSNFTNSKANTNKLIHFSTNSRSLQRTISVNSPYFPQVRNSFQFPQQKSIVGDQGINSDILEKESFGENSVGRDQIQQNEKEQENQQKSQKIQPSFQQYNNNLNNNNKNVNISDEDSNVSESYNINSSQPYQSQQLKIQDYIQYEGQMDKVLQEIDDSVRYQKRYSLTHSGRIEAVKALFKKQQGETQKQLRMNIFVRIAIFIQRLKESSTYWNPNLLKPNDYYFINDLAGQKEYKNRRYMQNGFWTDIATFIPLIIQLINATGPIASIMNMLIVFKIQDIYQILNKYNEMLSIKRNRIIPAIIKLLRLFLIVIFAAHILGCIWLGIATYQISMNWMNKYDQELISEDWFIKYIYGFYWAVTTMTSVGYGDISPSNEFETFICSFMMFAACFIFAYCFNLIGNIVDELNKPEQEFADEMRQVTRYFDEKNIDEELQTEVKKFLEYRHLAENQLSTQESKEILDKVPEGLKEKLMRKANLPYLQKLDLLNKSFSPRFLESLSLRMEERQLINNQVIFEQGEEQEDSNWAIYFLVSGNVQILRKNTNKLKMKMSRHIIKLLHQYDVFGHISFFSNRPYEYEARASGPTQLLMLKKSVLLEVLKDFDDDREVYCHIRDSSLSLDYERSLQIKCNNCDKMGHYVLKCPKLHYIPDLEKVILKYNYPMEHKRSQRYRRRDDRSWDSLLYFEEIQFIVEDLINDISTQEFEEFLNSMGEKFLIESQWFRTEQSVNIASQSFHNLTYINLNQQHQLQQKNMQQSSAQNQNSQHIEFQRKFVRKLAGPGMDGEDNHQEVQNNNNMVNSNADTMYSGFSPFLKRTTSKKRKTTFKSNRHVPPIQQSNMSLENSINLFRPSGSNIKQQQQHHGLLNQHDQNIQNAHIQNLNTIGSENSNQFYFYSDDNLIKKSRLNKTSYGQRIRHGNSSNKKKMMSSFAPRSFELKSKKKKHENQMDQEDKEHFLLVELDRVNIKGFDFYNIHNNVHEVVDDINKVYKDCSRTKVYHLFQRQFAVCREEKKKRLYEHQMRQIQLDLKKKMKREQMINQAKVKFYSVRKSVANQTPVNAGQRHFPSFPNNVIKNQEQDQVKM